MNVHIYNADEFGLFYQALPQKTLDLKKEKCSGGKHSKIRLTGMAAASMTGVKLPMFVIKGLQSLHVHIVVKKKLDGFRTF